MIKIVIGNMFDYPSSCLLVGSNVRGHCKSPTSLMSQVLPLLDEDSLENYKIESKVVSEYATVVVYYFKTGNNFDKLLVGYPGTAHQTTFQEMMENALATLNVDGFGGENTDVTMPLIGHSKTGLTLVEWADSFNAAIADRTEGHTRPGRYMTDITIVCKTQEQADYLNKTILPYPEAV